jgi:hypothetical protein
LFIIAHLLKKLNRFAFTFLFARQYLKTTTIYNKEIAIMEYVFHRLNALAQSGVCLALDKLLNANLRELLNEKTSRAGTRSKAEKARFAAKDKKSRFTISSTRGKEKAAP